jgi:hypothetical protein
MAAGRFDQELPLPKQGDITIKGPFDPKDPGVKRATLVFVIVQGEGANEVIVEGVGTWQRGRDDNKWSGKAARNGRHPGGNGSGSLGTGPARGIATSVVIQPEKRIGRGAAFEPPTIETLTWCANFKFV